MAELFAAKRLGIPISPHFVFPHFPVRAGKPEAYMGVGMSMSRNPGREVALDLVLYALHLAETYPKSTLIMADTLTIANRQAALGEGYEEAAKKVAEETRAKTNLLEAVREGYRIPASRLRIMSWEQVMSNLDYQKIMKKLRTLRSWSPYFRRQLYATIPEKLKSDVRARTASRREYKRELNRLSDYALGELAGILAMRGSIKVGHAGEEQYDRLAIWAAEKIGLVQKGHRWWENEGQAPAGAKHEDWVGIGDVMYGMKTDLAFAYLPSSIRPTGEKKEPYLVGRKPKTLLITDSEEELERKLAELGQKELDEKMIRFAAAVPSLRFLSKYDKMHPILLKDRELEQKGWDSRRFLVSLLKPVREAYFRRFGGKKVQHAIEKPEERPPSPPPDFAGPRRFAYA